MPIYDNAHESNYEELKTYYPVWYRDVFEMDALWRILGEELDGLQNGVLAFIANNFIFNADERTIREYEKFLYIPYDASRSLPERRKLVASYFVGNGHIGEREIRELTTMFCDGTCEITLIGGTVSIKIKFNIHSAPIMDDYFNALRRKIPAHLGVFTNVEVEFSHELFFGSYAAENGRYGVEPAPVGHDKTEHGNYIGSFAAVTERMDVQPHPQPGLSFATDLHGGALMAISEQVTIQPRPPGALSVSSEVKTGTGAAESAGFFISPAPPKGGAAGSTAFTGPGVIENSSASVEMLPAGSRSATSPAFYYGAGAVEITHYIIQGGTL